MYLRFMLRSLPQQRIPIRTISQVAGNPINRIEPARSVRGTHDRFGIENEKFTHIQKIGTSIAKLYCFEQISTPILEFSQVFERTLGSESDIVGKELYSFIDHDDKLTLRPEGTAGIVRALISNNMDRDLPKRFYYHGPMFRRERPQKGRLRQFEQFGIEMFGYENPTSDIEIIEMAWAFLNKIDTDTSFELEINSLADVESRAHYREVVKDYLSQNASRLSSDSVKRISTNPLRVLDSKNPEDIPIIQNCPSITEFYNTISAERFNAVCQGLQKLEIPYKINPRLVRGLDYYEDTVFEFKCTDSRLGASQGTVLAGGRYDNLVQLMGGKEKVPGIGWAAGLNRLAAILRDDIVVRERPIAVVIIQDRDKVILSAGNYSTSNNMMFYCYGLKISKVLRSHNIKTIFFHIPNANHSSLKTILANVVKTNASHAILVGEKEIMNDKVILKDLDLRIQNEYKLEDITN
ncbi:22331_t:CDS:2 [Cetraspora pellucida]|uniref:histidine--tRNA ligase n=1 Tax=Cetraspora pellucida TaxID=1433469 RepID=A0A9N9GIC1_9GLOM|nr:22331_t:CDS:2 [Cetraspora pellucida]